MIDVEALKNFTIDKSDWKKVKFGDIVFEPKESVKDPVAEGIEHVVGLEHIDSEDIHLRRSASIEESTTFTKRFRKGDVLFGRRRAYLKKAAKADFDGICSGDITVMRANEELLLPELLPFIVNNDKFFDFAIQHSAGGLSPRVKFKDLADFEFLLPSIEMQSELIVLFCSLNELIEYDITIAQNTKIAQQALWQSVKEECQTIKVKDIANVSNGTTPSTNNESYWHNGVVPWLSTGNVHKKFIFCSDKYITEKAIEERKSKIFKKGATLVAMIGQGKTRGMVAKLEIDAAINQNFACIVPDSTLNDVFLFYAFYFSYQRLRDISQGTNQLALNCELIGNFKIPFPNLNEQNVIADRLLQYDRVTELAEQKVADGVKLIKTAINKVF